MMPGDSFSGIPVVPAVKEKGKDRGISNVGAPKVYKRRAFNQRIVLLGAPSPNGRTDRQSSKRELQLVAP